MTTENTITIAHAGAPAANYNPPLCIHCGANRAKTNQVFCNDECRKYCLDHCGGSK